MAKFLMLHINEGVVAEKQVVDRRLIEEMHAISFPVGHQRSGCGLGIGREVVGDSYFLSYAG